MFWDGAIFLLSLVLGLTGWNIGLINSWRGPCAMVLATLVAQRLYIDFAAWIVQQLSLTPASAVVLSYVMLWLSLVLIIEIGLNVTIHLGSKSRPLIFDRVGGLILGLFKVAVIVTLPIMTQLVDINISPPRAAKIKGEQLPLIQVFETSFDESNLLPLFYHLAREALPSIGAFVVSTAEPSLTSKSSP